MVALHVFFLAPAWGKATSFKMHRKNLLLTQGKRSPRKAGLLLLCVFLSGMTFFFQHFYFKRDPSPIALHSLHFQRILFWRRRLFGGLIRAWNAFCSLFFILSGTWQNVTLWPKEKPHLYPKIAEIHKFPMFRKRRVNQYFFFASRAWLVALYAENGAHGPQNRSAKRAKIATFPNGHAWPHTKF